MGWPPVCRQCWRLPRGAVPRTARLCRCRGTTPRDLDSERERVLAAGGSARQHGVNWRIGTAGLQVTRCAAVFGHAWAAEGKDSRGCNLKFMLLCVCIASLASVQVIACGFAGLTKVYLPFCCRSIGDADLKEQGVTAEPQVTEFQLQPDDSFLIIASDGLWDAVSNSDAVSLVHDTVKQPAMCAQRCAAALPSKFCTSISDRQPSWI